MSKFITVTNSVAGTLTRINIDNIICYNKDSDRTTDTFMQLTGSHHIILTETPEQIDDIIYKAIKGE